MRAPIAVPLTGPISIADMKDAFPSIDSNSYKDYEGAAWYKPSTGEMGFIDLTDVDDLEFRGKVQAIVLHFTYNHFNVDLKSRLPYYYQGVTGVLAYIDAGVKIGSTSSGNPAFVVNGFTTPDGVKIINNGAIKGAGGNGGGAGGYNTYETVPVKAPVADPGNPGQNIPQPDPALDNPGLYGIYVRGTKQNSPTPTYSNAGGQNNGNEYYYPLEYWVFRAGKLTYHSIQTIIKATNPKQNDKVTEAVPQPDLLGDYQGSVVSYKNDGTYVAAYNIPGITTQEKTYHPSSSGSDSGDAGGTALFLNYASYVINNGSLVGGGGGGGAGAGGSTYGGCCGCGSVHYSGGAGGGGAGYSPGNYDATETVGGAGRSDNGTTGGRGGNPGQAGQGSSGGGGGAAGFAVQNSSFVIGGVGSIGGTVTGRT